MSSASAIGTESAPAKPVIAIDFDDTLAQTNHTLYQLHNEMYGTDLQFDEMNAFFYWKVRCFGDPSETMKKVKAMYASGKLADVPPVTDAAETLQELVKRGYKLAIVTARPSNLKTETENWISKHLPNCIDHIVFTGAFAHLGDPVDPLKHEEQLGDNRNSAQAVAVKPKEPDALPAVGKPLSKAAIIKNLGAIALVDDALENAVDCASKEIPVHLFCPLAPSGEIPVPHYPWNLRPSPLEKPEDFMSYEDRKARGLVTVQSQDIWGHQLPMPELIKRCHGWKDLLQHFPPVSVSVD